MMDDRTIKQQPSLFRRGDILLWGILFAALFYWYTSLNSSPRETHTAIIVIAGKERYRLDLRQPQELVLEEFGGAVKISVRRHAVAITDNDCQQKICLRMGPISHPGEMIVCVPKRILIIIPRQQEQDGQIKIITG